MKILKSDLDYAVLHGELDTGEQIIRFDEKNKLFIVRERRNGSNR